MIILTILLVYITGLLILWIFNQHKHLNIFEQIGFGFGIALSLFVLELFLQGIIFDKLSLILPIITFLVVFSIFIYKSIYEKHYIKEVGDSITHTFKFIKKDFTHMNLWKKVTGILIIFYVIFKIYMSFFINIHMPTFDEDAVAGWDLQTKVLLENNSFLVNDKNSSEYMGTSFESGRPLFLALSDYLLIGGKYVFSDKYNFTNIISILLYFNMLFLILGLIIRFCSLYYSFIGIYIFTSLPFIFIHGFASYSNILHSYFFIFHFSLLFLYFLEVKNKEIFYLLCFSLFPLIWVRKEGMIIFVFFLIFYIIYTLLYKGNKSYKNISIYGLFGFLNIILFNLFYKIYSLLVENNNSIVSNNNQDILSIAGFNLNLSNVNLDVFFLILKQIFIRPEFNLLFLLFFISTILCYFKNKKIFVFSMLLWGIVGFFIVFLMLWGGIEGNTSFVGFVRYGILFVPSILLLTIIQFYEFSKSK